QNSLERREPSPMDVAEVTNNKTNNQNSGASHLKRKEVKMKTKKILIVAAILSVAEATGLSQPIILSQPQSRTNVAGTTATFSVTATGTLPLSYQWQRDSGLPDFFDLTDRTE